MRTTVDIPDGLLAAAIQASKARTKTMAIVMGLEELIHRRQIEELRGLRGTLDLQLDVAASRRRKAR